MEYDNIRTVLKPVFDTNHSFVNGDINQISPPFIKNAGYLLQIILEYLWYILLW